jgi:NADH:ubiquinone oxidoreductase subunit H
MTEETHPTAPEPVSETPPEPAAPASLPEKQPLIAGRKLDEFGIGFLISFLFNFFAFSIYFLGLLVDLFMGTSHGFMNTSFFVRFGGIWMLANLIVMVALAIRHRENLKGMVAGYALIFFFTLILGLCMAVNCLNPS